MNRSYEDKAVVQIQCLIDSAIVLGLSFWSVWASVGYILATLLFTLYYIVKAVRS